MLVVLTTLASIGGLLFGYDTGTSGALVMLDHDFLLNDLDEELIVSLTVGGASSVQVPVDTLVTYGDANQL